MPMQIWSSTPNEWYNQSVERKPGGVLERKKVTLPPDNCPHGARTPVLLEFCERYEFYSSTSQTTTVHCLPSNNLLPSNIVRFLIARNCVLQIHSMHRHRELGLGLRFVLFHS
ncbi:hypothetical protein FS842_002260 [Serendipita sp. 407]|nr:hypothetical protein FS842_002260 [Serendipita sp. 407]